MPLCHILGVQVRSLGLQVGRIQGLLGYQISTCLISTPKLLSRTSIFQFFLEPTAYYHTILYYAMLYYTILYYTILYYTRLD